MLSYFFNYAITEDFVLKNPCFRIIIPGNAEQRKESKINPFTDIEIKGIKNELKNSKIEMIVTMALGTGLRLGELLCLSENDIDFDKSILSVSKSIKKVKFIEADGSHEYKTIIQKPKTRNSLRDVPLPSRLIPQLRQHIIKEKTKSLKNGVRFNADSYIFTTEACLPLDNKNLLRAWERALKRANIEYRNFHTLRHTYATKLFENDVPLKTVQMLLGHSNISITADTYTHVMPKEKNKAVDKLNYLF